MQLVVSLKNNLLLFLLLSLQSMSAQNLTYYADIQPIINDKCVRCHRKGQVAPFELTTFESVNRRAKFISKVINERYMPPNPANPSVSKFKNVKNLSQVEIDKIDAWVAQGKVKGEAVKNSINDSLSTAYREPDLVLTLQKPFIILGDNKEQFRVFVIPTNTTEDLYIEGIDFMPQNKQLAHHCRFMIDTTNRLRADDGIEVGSESEYQKLGVKMNDNFWHGWIPGNTAIYYPEGTAKRLPKGSDIVLNMHYAPSPKEVVEDSKILLYFSKKPPKRFIKTFVLEEDAITNQPFYIKKDTVIRYFMRSPIIPYDISLVSITPHMHLLGKNFKSFAITPDGDLIDLIKIDNWDFNWQITYQFEQLQKIPKGSVVYAEAEYDNTLNNKRNPYFPLLDVKYGWGIKDEMMNLIFQYLTYQSGDESKRD